MSLSLQDRKTIGEDIKTVQLGWPLGMPLVRKMEKSLWEIRIHLDKRIARLLFTTQGTVLVLLHGFIKKSTHTPLDDLQLARQRLKQLNALMRAPQ
ncbi:MAG: type II toxin-antitoxin system RelE/ParE family toxin [Moraxellaceae bacterium]|nr:type II toxin-antitoxin system RelE/ParE family toxin [Moraxellaceae bacterium]